MVSATETQFVSERPEDEDDDRKWSALIEASQFRPIVPLPGAPSRAHPVVNPPRPPSAEHPVPLPPETAVPISPKPRVEPPPEADARAAAPRDDADRATLPVVPSPGAKAPDLAAAPTYDAAPDGPAAREDEATVPPLDTAPPLAAADPPHATEPGAGLDAPPVPTSPLPEFAAIPPMPDPPAPRLPAEPERLEELPDVGLRGPVRRPLFRPPPQPHLGISPEPPMVLPDALQAATPDEPAGAVASPAPRRQGRFWLLLTLLAACAVGLGFGVMALKRTPVQGSSPAVRRSALPESPVATVSPAAATPAEVASPEPAQPYNALPVVAKPEPAEAAPAQEAPPVVVYHHRDSAEASRVAQQVRPLSPQVGVRATSAPPRRPTIRYFRAKDAATAKALAVTLHRDGSTWRVQDHTARRRRQTAGAVEVWLPNR